MKIKVSSCTMILILMVSSCYNHNLEDLGNSEGCNTINLSYQTDIRRIINISCNVSGCHNAGSTTTFSLVTHQELKAQADNGLLLKSINHAPGVSPMPQSVSKLSKCTIDKITAWVEAGSPNN